MTTTTPTPANPRRRRLLIGGGILAVIVAAVGVGLWWFFRDDAPAEVDLATAVEQVAPEDDAAPLYRGASDDSDAAVAALFGGPTAQTLQELEIEDLVG